MTQPNTDPLQPQALAPRVRLCTGEVLHKRLRPAKNAFRYGVFFIRVPVRAMTAQTVSLPYRFFRIIVSTCCPSSTKITGMVGNRCPNGSMIYCMPRVSMTLTVKSGCNVFRVSWAMYLTRCHSGFAIAATAL
jgi:hypothetical protein